MKQCNITIIHTCGYHILCTSFYYAHCSLSYLILFVCLFLHLLRVVWFSKKVVWSAPRIELGTSSTLKKNHTPRPSRPDYLFMQQIYRVCFSFHTCIGPYSILSIQNDKLDAGAYKLAIGIISSPYIIICFHINSILPWNILQKGLFSATRPQSFCKHLENAGIEPATSCMLSTRSTNWANSPATYPTSSCSCITMYILFVFTLYINYFNPYFFHSCYQCTPNSSLSFEQTTFIPYYTNETQMPHLEIIFIGNNKQFLSKSSHLWTTTYHFLCTIYPSIYQWISRPA